MRVLHVKTGADREMGGSVTAFAGVARTTALAGDEATILSLTRPGDDLSVIERERAHGVQLVLIDRGRMAPFGLSMRLLGWLWRNVKKFDLVEVHEVYAFPVLAVAIAATLRRIPYVVHPHNSLDPYDMRKHAFFKRLLRPGTRWVLGLSAGLWFTTDEEAQRSDDHGASVAKIVSPLSVVRSAQRGDRERFRQAYAIPDDDFVLLFLGRLDPKKGLPRTIEAFASSRVPGSWLVIAGSGPAAFTAQIEEIVRSSPSRERILMPGYLKGEGHVDALSGSDLFVLHSDNENFGLAPVEATLEGLPCLLSRDVYVAAELERAGAALVIETSATALTRTMGDLMRDSEAMRQLTEHARTATLPFADGDVAQRDWAIRRDLVGASSTDKGLGE